MDAQQPQQVQDEAGDERSPGYQMKKACTFRVTVVQAFFFSAMPYGLWDLISLTKDHTWALRSDSTEP